MFYGKQGFPEIGVCNEQITLNLCGVNITDKPALLENTCMVHLHTLYGSFFLGFLAERADITVLLP